jgi:hypothetical protein
MPPSVHLIPTFEAAIEDFNNAQNDKDYRNFLQYLYLTDKILIQKVDDPESFVTGYAANIIQYLNDGEADPLTPKFPQFDYKKPPHGKEHRNKIHELVGDVTGTGKYQDIYTDPATIDVQYCLRFKKNGQGIWLLVTALVAPI